MSKIILASSDSGAGAVTVQAPATSSNRVLTLEDADGTLAPLVLATAQTASGTSVNFTGIPSWVKRVTVMLDGVSTSGTSDVMVQLATASGFITTGYVGSAITVVSSASPGASAYSTGFLIRMGGGAAAAAVRHGVVKLELINANNWIGEVNVSLSNTVYWAGGAGSLNAVNTVTGLRITTVNGTDTFDAGTVNIMYE
jgi:hypothetical protein